MNSNVLAVALALTFLASACSRTEPAAATASPVPPAEQRYALRGEVISVDPARHVLIVKHEEIKDYMPAMTMEFDEIGRAHV